MTQATVRDLNNIINEIFGLIARQTGSYIGKTKFTKGNIFGYNKKQFPVDFKTNPRARANERPLGRVRITTSRDIVGNNNEKRKTAIRKY